MSIEDFRQYYWMKADLQKFARELGVSTGGYKPELASRIERRLLGKRAVAEPKQSSTKERDSDRKLTRDTPVVNYKSDEKTRAFFESQIGPEFHFTYQLNQYRFAHKNLTYGDLVDQWIAERDKRRNPDYVPPIAAHGKYNRFIRAFFADPKNKGKSMKEAAAAWNAVKTTAGNQKYVRSRKKAGGQP
ncbi:MULTISPECIES: DUF6434 domain-containing protein [unclassified Bradyrhizobium]|uniref:DUF6434 domain-containing protein n=1 Tax=unclassified Bradyrhizobium TaxID=2631580 RepID=UPI00247A33EC|nr:MULTISPECIES: DUF6434 domain-containing protein [unclassified Bradyrhizobium]WGR72927.1 SAP domain-containing protein [Bradyrhizobium sp. ISRA426]WGR77762.1 SAP domain-containing protein [Bradyrhizobium sp. ISRA430]WGR88167.1 SAP domain-containing protein [Bradyrhizobium sp. ISRA432]